jgi:hypothetical protein
LRAEQVVQLNPPGRQRFDASGLLRMPSGELLTVNDRESALYRIEFLPDGISADLKPLKNCFTGSPTVPSAGTMSERADYEGIARDEQGRLYLCEEANRLVLRCGANTNERLPIDWAPVKKFFSADANASFEGIAVGGGKMYVANERSSPVIIVVDLGTLKVIDHFVVSPQTGSFLGILHYSDLSWHDGRLFVLCRHHRVILEVDPDTRNVLAEFDYRELEDQLGYKTAYPTGIMEGLAVDRDFIWLVTDNNGLSRGGAPNDIRPTLLKCPRPGNRKRADGVNRR